MNHGLKKHSPSRKDFSHRKTFGSFDISQLPRRYMLPSTILNQGVSSACTAYSACAVAESRYGKQFDPNQFFYDEGVVNGYQNVTGYDLRIAMDTARKIGFYSLVGGERIKEDGYFSLNNPFNSLSLADDIRIGMYLAKDEKRAAECGTMWYQEWSYAPKGIVQKGYTQKTGLHAIKVMGWTDVDSNGAYLNENKDVFLAVQNSYGEGIGDKGIFYFPMDIASKEFIEGAYLWRSQQEKVKTQGILISLLQQVILLYKRAINAMGSLLR